MFNKDIGADDSARGWLGEHMYGWQPGVVTRTLQSDCHNANPIAWNQRMIFRIGGDISRGTPRRLLAVSSVWKHWHGMCIYRPMSYAAEKKCLETFLLN